MHTRDAAPLNKLLLAWTWPRGYVAAEADIYAVGFGGGQVVSPTAVRVLLTEDYRVTQRGRGRSGQRGHFDLATRCHRAAADFAPSARPRARPGNGQFAASGQWVTVGVGQPTLMIGGLDRAGMPAADIG